MFTFSLKRKSPHKRSSFRPRLEELESRWLPSILVTSAADTDVAGTLRNAMENIGSTPDSTIAFAIPGSGQHVISLTAPLPLVTGPMTIDGTTQATGTIAVSGSNQFPVFQSSGGVLTINDLTMENGYSAGNGGGIENAQGSVLYLNDCIILNNSAAGSGGGIDNRQSSSAILERCTITGNTAGVNGGGVESGPSAATFLTNCTVEGNTAAGNGGGIDNNGFFNVPITSVTSSGTPLTLTVTTGSPDGLAPGSVVFITVVNNGTSSINAVYTVLTTPSTTTFTVAATAASDYVSGGVVNAELNGSVYLTDSTVAGNSATQGGGLYNNNSAQLWDSIVADNPAPPSASTANIPTAVDLYSTNGITHAITNFKYSLVGTTNLTPATLALGHTLLGVDPLLGPLMANGGLTPTMALAPGSPAIGAGLALGDPSQSYFDPRLRQYVTPPIKTDQRGLPRPYGSGAAVDIGAYQTQPQATTAPVTPVAPVVSVSNVSQSGNTVAFDVAASEASLASGAAFTYQINWGDNSSSTYTSSLSALAVSHSYAAAGAYQITVTATDPANRTSKPVTLNVTVSGHHHHW